MSKSEILVSNICDLFIVFRTYVCEYDTKNQTDDSSYPLVDFSDFDKIIIYERNYGCDEKYPPEKLWFCDVHNFLFKLPNYFEQNRDYKYANK